jgi:hypothetical protein
VAPRLPASADASSKDMTPGFLSRSDRMIARCTPELLP